jgi:hypothetical protein
MCRVRFVSVGAVLLLAAYSTSAQDEPLPEAALRQLVKFAASIDSAAPLPAIRPGRVKYYTGISHTLQGVVVRGHRSDGSADLQPPGNTFYHEFHYDECGKLLWVVEHAADGQRCVTSKMIYDGATPLARLTYGPIGLCFGDYVSYQQGEAQHVTRIGPDGKVYLIRPVYENRSQR